MTPGQHLALRQLRRLRAADPAGFEFGDPKASGTDIVVPVSLRIGDLQKRESGLKVRDRENFDLHIGADFPFARPHLTTSNPRFAGFPHVNWSKWLCLHQSEVDWDPADGLYGYFDRLSHWIGRAAINDMDPVEGPLEPPYNYTDSARTPFHFSVDAPAAAGDLWLGLAEVRKHSNRNEVIAWHKLGEVPEGAYTAPVVILPKRLPMEFPINGGAFFRILNQQGVSRDTVITLLQWAAFHGDPADPTYLALGSPARRGPEGTPRQHFAVWATDFKKTLKLTAPDEGDAPELADLRRQVANDVLKKFEGEPLRWCPVFDDRPEIVVRRDKGRPLAWMQGKQILVLGAGAIGSWAAELLARAAPSVLHIVDKAKVKPGLLVRQNYRLGDIGADKGPALADHLRSITRAAVEGFNRDAISFLLEDLDRAMTYDLIIDCTASRITQMQLESHWPSFKGKAPRFASFGIDARAEKVIGVELQPGSSFGPWLGYLQLKNRLTRDKEVPAHFLDAFYSDKPLDELFQPEPGCSDPTFAGSAADSAAAAASFLNLIAIPNKGSWGYALSTPGLALADAPMSKIVQLQDLQLVDVYGQRVYFSSDVFASARDHVKDNNRRRTKRHETGGLLWGYWDEAVNSLVVFDASGPPPDSVHSPARFICGTRGTRAKHETLKAATRGACGFVGLWHTHPDMAPHQSNEDIVGMATVVAGVAQNRRRALMLIFGRRWGRPEAGVYVYESADVDQIGEKVQCLKAIVPLLEAVV